jgi:tRNA(adenine34) deaminase
MCAGALYWSQISKIIIGAQDHHRGYRVMGTQLHPKTEVIFGVMEEECSQLIKSFFKCEKLVYQIFTRFSGATYIPSPGLI